MRPSYHLQSIPVIASHATGESSHIVIRDDSVLEQLHQLKALRQSFRVAVIYDPEKPFRMGIPQ